MLDDVELANGTISGKYITFVIDEGVTIDEDIIEDFVVVADVIG
jgi:hypothetical protein